MCDSGPQTGQMHLLFLKKNEALTIESWRFNLVYNKYGYLISENRSMA